MNGKINQVIFIQIFSETNGTYLLLIKPLLQASWIGAYEIYDYYENFLRSRIYWYQKPVFSVYPTDKRNYDNNIIYQYKYDVY